MDDRGAHSNGVSLTIVGSMPCLADE
jgi:hypothetical protein